MAGEYAETAMLLAVLEGRDEDARRMMSDLYPGEARDLHRACDRLGTIYWDVKDNEGFKGGLG